MLKLPFCSEGAGGFCLGETNGKNSLHKKAKGEQHGPPTPVHARHEVLDFFNKNHGTLGGVLRTTFGFIKPPIS
jgi:hypothetical protein